ncbi:MAG TPA: T9SS type A sorting domain-containing protein [Ferruginibacter sp.]|nr:T9SS type A sorting domain-containing protein [Ferruginibacter sp.]
MQKYLLCFFITSLFFEGKANAHPPGNRISAGTLLMPPPCSMNGTYSIGSGGDFPTISRAIDSLKVRGIGGNLLFELLPNYSSTSEVFPILFPKKSQVPCFFSSNYKVVLRPASNAVNLEIVGNLNNGVIRLDSCDYLTIDGRPGGLGTISELKIINIWAAAVQFLNSSNNVIKYLSLSSWVQFTLPPGTFGIVDFHGSPSGTIGSANNKIESCELFSGSTVNYSGWELISSNGPNFNDSIINCNFHHFNRSAIGLTGDAWGWEILGNSFYTPFPIILGSFISAPANFNNDAHKIENNYFGGSAPHCGGSPFEASFSGDLKFIDADWGTGNIQNNYFRRMKLTATGGNTPYVCFISQSAGSNLNSVINHNYFGGTDLSDSIQIINANTNATIGPMIVECISNGGAFEVAFNEIDNIRCYSDSVVKAIDVTLINGGGTIHHNIVGHPSVYNSIINNTNGTMFGIKGGRVNSNIVSNLTNNSPSGATTGANASIFGIYCTGDSTCNNQVFRLSGKGNYTSQTSVGGIISGSGRTHNNLVHSLFHYGAGGDMIGISGGSIKANIVHTLIMTNPVNMQPVYGISGGDSITNNMVRLGFDTAGNSITNPVNFRGISGGNNVLHNSVYIGGDNVLINPASRSSTCNIGGNVVRNNIFVNTRSNQATSSSNRHYCMYLSSTGAISNYNLFLNNGTGAYFGLINSTGYSSFALWKTGTGKDLNSVYGDPLFINPSGNYSQVDLHLSNGTIAEAVGTAAGTIQKDFDGETRSSLTPVDIGADAGDFNQCAVTHAGNDVTICSGQNAQIGTPAIPNHTYSWTSNPAGFTSPVANPIVNPTITTAYYLVMTNAAATCTAMDTVIVSVTTPLTPSITINTTTAAVCSGATVSFTSSITNGGSAASYQWKVNGINAGTNNPIFISNTLINGDQVSCVLTSSESCITSSTVTSNVISVIVNASVTPSVSINTPTTTICSGTLASFTATPINEGTAPSYQWQVNGINAGTNSNFFNTFSLNNNDQVKVILTSSLACATPASVTSNIISMTVTPLPFVNAGNDTTICAGTSAQLQGSGGSTYSWSPATGLSNPNIANPIATPLVTTRYYLTVSNSATCFAVDSVLVTVNLSTSASVNISATNTTICSGSSVTFTATANGGGSNPVYQWQVNGINAGTNSSTFTTTTLNNNDLVKVIMTSSLPCVSPQTVMSNTLIVAVAPGLVANAGIDAGICAGGSVQLQGSGGSIYSWSPAAGLSNPLIANPVASPLSTTAYILTVSNGGTCTSQDIVVITVNQLVIPTADISTANTNICSGTAVTFTATTSNGGTAPVYQWQLNGINAGTNSNTFTSSSLQNNDQVKFVLTSNLACVLNPTATSNTITMSAQQLATPLITLSNSVFTVTNPDVAANYSWQVFLNSNWINVIPAATGISFTSPGTGEYRVKADKGACTAYSASVVAGIVNPTSHVIYLRPNPAHEFIRLDSIRLQKRYETVEITDMQGKRVLPLFNVRNRVTITIDISSLTNGPYMAIIRQYDGTFSAKKFIKQ